MQKSKLQSWFKSLSLILSIIVSLGVISTYFFDRFMWRAKQVEARHGLLEISDLQRAYFKANKRYFGPDAGDSPLYLTSPVYFQTSDDASTCVLENALSFEITKTCKERRYFFVINQANTKGFTASAKEIENLPQNQKPAPKCKDRKLDEWSINQSGEPKAIYDSVFECTKVLFW